MIAWKLQNFVDREHIGSVINFGADVDAIGFI